MDSQIITVLFNDVIKAAKILDKDYSFIKSFSPCLKRFLSLKPENMVR